ncbi:reverse transcriptase domain-containing protein [Tanacetum coccineum]
MSDAPDGEAEEEYFRMPEVPPEIDDTEVWTLFTDGATSLKGSGAGLVLIGPSGLEYTYALRLTFVSTNNEAEYEALLAGSIVQEKILGPDVEVRGSFTSKLRNPGNPHGICGMHIRPQRASVRKAMRQGYYWPTMHADAKEEVDKCDSCQIHTPIPRLPKTHMTSIMAPWPFYQWGMDILGPLTPARGGKEVIRFVMDNIICRFGLPRIIVTDNGAQLVNEPFKGWCTRFKIQQMNTSVAHPQANGLVERANRSLMEGIKTRLGRERAGWVDELPNVLWAHRTSIKQSNGETPFSLTYGSEAVIPAEIGIPSYRTLMIREEYNEEEQRLNLDLLQERREAASDYCIEGMKQAGWRMKESWDQIGNAHIESTEAFGEWLLTSCKAM